MLNETLRREILKFRDDWRQFHNLRTLSTSIVLEAAELAEHSQWARDNELDAVVRDRKPQIEHEVADIVILLTYLAEDLGIDVERAVREKLEFNAKRYPVERAKGSARKYDQL